MGMHPQDWWGRKQFYAMNGQCVGDFSKKIRNVVAKWSASTLDARVWRNSQAKTNIEIQNMIQGTEGKEREMKSGVPEAGFLKLTKFAHNSYLSQNPRVRT